MKGRSWGANGLLLVTAAVWGFAFVAQRIGMEHVGPFVFNGIRFALGSLTLVPVLLFRRRRAASRSTPSVPPRRVLAVGVGAGLVLFLGASLQQVGIVYTTAGKAGFITGLYVVLVPILGTVWGQRVRAGGWSGAALAAAGLYFLSVQEGFTISPGDGLVLASAFFWAAHVLWIGRWCVRVDPIELAFLQFGTCSVLSLATSVAVETVTMEGIARAGIPILYGGVLSVGLAYTLQVVAQRHARPTPAAILLSLEAVFAAVGGWAFLHEILGARELLGCALMLGGVLASQLGRRDVPAPGKTAATPSSSS